VKLSQLACYPDSVTIWLCDCVCSGFYWSKRRWVAVASHGASCPLPRR